MSSATTAREKGQPGERLARDGASDDHQVDLPRGVGEPAVDVGIGMANDQRPEGCVEIQSAFAVGVDDVCSARPSDDESLSPEIERRGLETSAGTTGRA